MEGTGQGSRNSISLGRWDLKTWASVEKKVEGLSGLGLDVAPERLAEFFRKAEWEASDRKAGVKPDKGSPVHRHGTKWGSVGFSGTEAFLLPISRRQDSSCYDQYDLP